MDVERTIEFILKSQANAERRMDKFDKRLDGISKLIKQGMRILAQTAEAQKRTDIALAELAQAQKETPRSLKAFIKSLRRGGNGRNG
jgi:hypothetical protein